MFRSLRTGYVRHFLSGFAMGAIALVGFHAAQPEDAPMFAATTEAAAPVS